MFKLITNRIIINSSKNSLKNFSNSPYKNKRLFCSVGKPIEISQLKQSFSELLKLDYKKIQEEGLPKNLLEIQNDILKSNENELDTQTRMISSIFLWRSLCFLNQTPNTMKKEELDKLWNLLNIDSKDIINKHEYISILNHRIGISFTSRYLLPKLFDDIKRVVKEVKDSNLKKDDDNNKTPISSLLPLINIAFTSSAHLDMWKEMKYLGNEISLNKNEIFDNIRNAAFEIDYLFDYTSINHILNLTNTQQTTSLLPSIIDTNKESEQVNIEKFKTFRVYDVESFSFKDLTMKTENMSTETNEKAMTEFNENKNQMKNQKIDRNGYFTTELSYPPFILILGSSFKFDICFDTNSQMTHSGVIDKDFKKVQLYGTYDEFDKTKVESEYNLAIDQTIVPKDENESFIQLKGTHRKIETRINSEKTIYDMDVVINLQRRKLLHEVKDSK
ncbi:hypothetical protein RB653_003547 [Dictyostelium firmibasis]|uniref:Uncharacterized protein n=1 Tax=Dictyostelium firmibasis TaxID=79012 RepID=A0AAN7U5Y9_9MYCE